MAAISELFSMSKSEMTKKTKEDLMRMILDAKKQHVSDKSDNDNSIQGVLTTLTQCTQALQKEVGELRSEVQSVQTKIPRETSNAPNDSTDRISFAQVVRNSVRETMQEETSKSHLILSRIDEETDVETLVSNICNTMSVTAKPTGVERLGKKTEGKKRLIKATFPTPFDARTFKSRFDELRKDGDANLPNIRVRPGKTKAEREVFSKNSAIAHKLNADAKREGLSVSFSLRDNGAIWKFEKHDDGKWRKVKDWKPPSALVTPTNETTSDVSDGESSSGNE